MGGRRKEYDGNYAVFEVGFVLGDPRLDFVTDVAWRLYSTLWVIAVKERREVLPSYYYPPSSRSKSGFSGVSLARRSRVDHRSIASALANLVQNRLIELHVTGEITVIGVKSKHPNLKWKDKGITEVIGLEKENKKKEERRIRKRKKKEEVEYVGGLRALKIDKSIFEEFKKEIQGIDHDDELRKADLWRLDNPPKSKNPNDHLFLRNWFQRARKGKGEDGKSDLSKYDGL